MNAYLDRIPLPRHCEERYAAVSVRRSDEAISTTIREAIASAKITPRNDVTNA